MSRIIGRVETNGKEFCINQHMEAQPNGIYKILDKDKRAEYEAEKQKATENNSEK